MPIALRFRSANKQDVQRCFEIEQTAYSGDEAASREKIALRIERYPEGFLIAEDGAQVLGFINAGCCEKVELSDEEFKSLIGHDPNGKHIVVMSVAVDPIAQKQGIARALMQEFVTRMQSMQKQDIYLICQTNLIPMYTSFGFRYLNPSSSEHGGLKWHEMVYDLSADNTE